MKWESEVWFDVATGVCLACANLSQMACSGACRLLHFFVLLQPPSVRVYLKVFHFGGFCDMLAGLKLDRLWFCAMHAVSHCTKHTYTLFSTVILKCNMVVTKTCRCIWFE